MKDRVLLLIKSKNFTAAQFADEIGVQKSGVSHILSGRNNPSLDFIQKILTRFPDISTDWLLFGKGPMMINDIPATFNLPPVSVPSGQPRQFADLFSQELPVIEVPEKIAADNEELIHPANKSMPEAVTESVEEIYAKSAEANKLPGLPGNKGLSEKPSANKTIQKIIVMYDDKTFAEFLPES
ncbi:MAG TPA: helix-turn-helix transcriptional regulator [Bacteroidales bacterium]|jgi:transcriptional regulator with XRE-family HTH domain|nr:helix-turn-helix transcriptional regulator [Bacteroidales bacterium]